MADKIVKIGAKVGKDQDDEDQSCLFGQGKVE
jgi:hypothetical protein